MPEDALLLQGLKAGSPDAFARLFDTYVDRLYRLAMSLVGDPYEAEDIVRLKQAGIGLSGSYSELSCSTWAGQA